MTTLKSKLCSIAIKIDHIYVYDKLELSFIRQTLLKAICLMLYCHTHICLTLIIIWKEHIFRMHLDEPLSILIIFQIWNLLKSAQKFQNTILLGLSNASLIEVDVPKHSVTQSN